MPSFTHQDWDNVVFNNRKPSTSIENKQPKQKFTSDEEIPTIKKTNKVQQLSMAKYRIASGYKSQKLLADATKGKISQSRINELESGKGAAPNGNEKQILFKLIKIKF